MTHPLKDKYVVVMGANYIHCGTLEAMTVEHIVLLDPSIIYETGDWKRDDWKDAQRLPTNRIYLDRPADVFEVIREGKKTR